MRYAYKFLVIRVVTTLIFLNHMAMLLIFALLNSSIELKKFNVIEFNN